MVTVSVSKNIEVHEKNLRQLLEQKDQATAEIFRLEGAIRLLKNFKDLGVEEIHGEKSVEDVIENTEVIDGGDAVSGGSEQD